MLFRTRLSRPLASEVGSGGGLEEREEVAKGAGCERGFGAGVATPSRAREAALVWLVMLANGTSSSCVCWRPRST